jgi:hypothetical protein
LFDSDDWQLACRAPKPQRAEYDAGRLLRQETRTAAVTRDANAPPAVKDRDLKTDPDTPLLLARMLDVARKGIAEREAKASTTKNDASKPNDVLSMIKDMEKEFDDGSK